MQLIDSTAKTNWIFVGIIAAFAVFAVGGILLLQGVGLGPSSPTPTPAPTPQPRDQAELDFAGDRPELVEGWQTYRNAEFGFEVKYPMDLIGQKVESDTTLLAITDRDSSHYFSIHVRKNYKIDQILSTIEETKEINIGDHLGYEYFYIEGAGASEVALIQVGQDALSISFDYIGDGQKFATAEDKKDYVQDFFSQILSTFRFVDNTRVCPGPDCDLDKNIPY
ncbi:MAG: hypothetical protein A2940_00585 [Candidatus Wildermuthbacteria bacterium RIFCSPLOWO2_01_FULL_48_29]|uniref:Uncharacterized protein n=2 Tax=Parcubacteria group TaxID=1794811 RepID=A0A1G2RJV9_9BACT|nr:MAG: hypothetical protein A2669_00595 [Candidatus Yanofskybacteria bacterium RIFCSPHIGHO2_01_FULL_48_25b]OHA73124.1 MAG: hypothetical protein A2940_00585 [Candidatus Wildermuthbacteria bacterium RIFCSPLOWO2_01_FULL_48_29]